MIFVGFSKGVSASTNSQAGTRKRSPGLWVSHICGQISIIPKPELRGFWGDLPLGVRSSEVAIIWPNISFWDASFFTQQEVSPFGKIRLWASPASYHLSNATNQKANHQVVWQLISSSRSSTKVDNLMAWFVGSCHDWSNAIETTIIWN